MKRYLIRKNYVILYNLFHKVLGGEGDKLLYLTMPCSTWRLPFFVIVNFRFVLFIIFETFKTLLAISPATMDMQLFVAGAKHTLRVVFSPVLLVCHSSSFRYLLKLCVVLLNTIYDIICSFIWPMFTTYCELHAVNKIKMTKDSPFSQKAIKPVSRILQPISYIYFWIILNTMEIFNAAGICSIAQFSGFGYVTL